MARIDIPAGEGGDAVQIWSLQPELSRAVNRLTDAAYNKSILPTRVREAARMRIAELNDCVVCRSFRAESVKAQGLTEDFYLHVSTHPVGEYSEQERLAIAFAEQFATDHLAIDDAFMDTMRRHFTDAEILDLSICVAHFLGLGRLLRVLGISETCVVDV